MRKIGIFGTGHLGKIHIKCLQKIDHYQIVGFYDPDDEEAVLVENNFNIKKFNSPEELLSAIDIVDIVSPTYTHFEIAQKAIQAGKHLFIEKPVCTTLVQAVELKQNLEKSGLHLQVGHVERYNPAWTAAKSYFNSPLFIEGHRLAPFNPRGTDVSVVEDLMIHDLDLVLQIVKSAVQEVHANGVSIISDQADICNARIQFENGAVANLTASRISLKQMRKLRVFKKMPISAWIFLREKQKSFDSWGKKTRNRMREPSSNYPCKENLKKYKLFRQTE